VTRLVCAAAAVLVLAGAATAAADDEPVEATPTASEAAPTATLSPESVLEQHRAKPLTTASVPTEGERSPFDMHLYWERGINYTVLQRIWLGTKDVSLLDENATLTGRIGLKLGLDTAGYIEGGSVPDVGTRFNLRRALFYTTGEFRFVYPILFKFDLGGVGDSLYFSDFYFWAKDVPYVGTVKLGQFDAPMSLEALSGSTNETFMEYGSPVAAFAPGLKVGLQLADHTESRRVTWAFGYFTDGQEPDVGDASASIARLTGRVTWLAVQPEADDDLLLHLGASASYVLSSRDRIRYNSRPESFLYPDIVDTGDLETNNAFPFGLELATRRGPVTIQAEYLASVVDAGDLGSAYLEGAYVSAGWFVTGEHRAYDRSVGQIGGLVPALDFDPWQRHWGAWELAARVSWLDLSDGQIRGGQLKLFMGGINWYWNRYVRFMFNAGYARVNEGTNDGRLGILQARFQLAF